MFKFLFRSDSRWVKQLQRIPHPLIGVYRARIGTDTLSWVHVVVLDLKRFH